MESLSEILPDTNPSHLKEDDLFEWVLAVFADCTEQETLAGLHELGAAAGR